MLPWRRFALAAAFLLFLPLGLALADKPAAGEKEMKMPEREPFGHFTVDQVARRLDQPNTYVYDGNRKEVYAENHVPGAVRLYHTDIKEGVLPQDKNATLIFYCHNEL